MRSPVACSKASPANVGGRRDCPRLAAKSASTQLEYAWATAADSRRRSFSVWWRAKSRKSWIAISPVTNPARTMPARKRSGRRTRRDDSDESTRGALNRAGVPLHVARRRHLVADPPDRDDRRGVAELPPQLADVHVDGPRVPGEGVPPHPL